MQVQYGGKICLGAEGVWFHLIRGNRDSVLLTAME
jgi:hypothetical protein